MGVGAGLYMCDVVKKFTFAISSPDEFLSIVVLAPFFRIAEAVCNVIPPDSTKLPTNSPFLYYIFSI